ncbi:uncharacterized protein LOC115878053 [Sitophilus oryzae]|uniref:Uncharacterized protein LOC115878053 n=1 Tax=Sitophilus oryzae TaxID=7048 RepID=A0A6J2XGL7_SITOR|nr:uncharacterized protein LOC115878053 [Sitophilus oryzae]
MQFKILILSFLVSFILEFNLAYNDYTWRDYYPGGTIPSDAFSPGNDVNGNPLYIGQVLIKKNHSDIVPTTIYPDEPVYGASYGVKPADNFVQILCSQRPEYFTWTRTNSTDLHLLTNSLHFIRGGVEDGKWLYIGRVNYQGDIAIGKVLAGNIGDALMYFVYKDKELNARSFDVLTYNGNNVLDINFRSLPN